VGLHWRQNRGGGGRVVARSGIASHRHGSRRHRYETTMSSRRSGANARAGSNSRRQALDDLKRLRTGGLAPHTSDEQSSRIAQYKPQEESIYKTVTEQEYEEIVRQRRQGLPFVENDDGEMGYYDDGEEQFFESDPEVDPNAAQEEEDDAKDGKKRSAGALSSAYARRAKKMQRAKLNGAGDQKITNMFFSASAGSKGKGATGGAKAAGARGRGGRAAPKRDIDLDSMLDDLTSNPTEARPMLAPRPTSYSSGSSMGYTASSTSASSMSHSRSTRAQLPRTHDDDVEYDDAPQDVYQGDNDNAFEPDHETEEPMEVNDDAAATNDADKSAVKNEEEEPTPAPALSKRELLLQKARANRLQTTQPTARALAGEMEPKPEAARLAMPSMPVDDVPSNEVAEWWAVGGGDVTKTENNFKQEEEPEFVASEDAIHMYWLDAVEVRDRPGKLYLIGKMKEPGAKGSAPVYKSCCVIVNNLERYMYLVPKIPKDMLRDGEDEHTLLKDLDKPRQQELWMKMHEEIRRTLVPSCIAQRKDQDAFQTKLVTRNYAFELADIPRGKNLVLKVKYPARYPAPPSETCTHGGKYFSRICGAFTRPLENFLLKRRFLGPSWLEIKNVRKSTENVSFCHYEYEVMDPKNVSTMPGIGAAPPLTVMSLSLKSFCNPNSGKHEVVALSSITETGVSSDGGSSGVNRGSQHRISHFTAIRPLDSNVSFPDAYVRAVQDDERFGMKQPDGMRAINNERLHIEFNERAMLSYFLTRVQMEDQDVIVGHNLHKYALDLLISRIDNHKLGGLWSKLTRLRRGRLNPMNMGEGWNEYRMDDVINGRLYCDTYVSAKELLTSQSSYSLSHLVQSLLQKQRVDVEMNDIPQILHGGPDNFVRFLRHTLDDAMFVLQLMHKLEVLPLSKQLSTLCGYLWSRTLEANKRAERIEYLLLHEFSRSKQKFIVPEKFRTKTEADKAGGNKRREASYAGGMVFAPKKGLYDNFVVLLDFNSLYPSIIREYNICFTTVERKLLDEKEAAKASSGSSGSKKKRRKTGVEGDDEAVVDDDLDDGVEAPAGPSDDSEIPPLPSSSCEEGVLPGVIKRLLESRKMVKQQLKAETKAGNMEKATLLDIRQRAIKLTANSMYGCLGFRFSRFYAKPIAALITSTGRQTLQRAKEVAEQECGYDVIYGDTDSIMVDSRSDKLDDAKRIGREVQMQCNKHFKLLELEVDYIFKAILLLNKKKYAALVLKERPNGEPTFEKEVKGLDMVRRDWCVISKAIGHDILDVILSGRARDDVVETIHEHLEQVAERIRSGKEPLEQFVITKSLNKQPEQYPDKAKQYHVQVALALKQQGKPIGAGTHIPYVLCKEEEPGSGRRAYHPEEVKRANGALTLDIDWYLESQIHPPVNRLCAHIEGTSSPQLAHCLGLDTSKFTHSVYGAGANDDAADAIPSVLQNDADRFKDCLPLELTCNKCQQKSAFTGVYRPLNEQDPGRFYVNGLTCASPACGADFWGYDQEGVYGNVGDDLLAVLSNRLHLATRVATKKYYEGWVVCSDAMCKTRTQKQSLRGTGNICSAPRCRASVKQEYSDHALYTQLRFYESLFDISRAQTKIQEQNSRAVATAGPARNSADLPPLSDRHQEIFKKLRAQAEKAVRQNDYNWVKPSIWQSLFAS
ncbi:TPA: hypothetical protein N0F65_010511, partial [Lagenidium giganteum]